MALFHHGYGIRDMGFIDLSGEYPAMAIVRKIVGVALGLICLGVLIHFIFNPLYAATDAEAAQMWSVANWFMAFGMVAAILFGIHQRMSAQGLEANDPKRICAELTLYGIMALAILFFWNWVDDLASAEEQSQTRRNWWPLINAAFIVLMGYISDRLIRSR